MNAKTQKLSPATAVADAHEALQEMLFEPADVLERLVKEQDLNAEYMARLNDVALRGAHMLVARQSAALRETFDELSIVLKEAASKGLHPDNGDAHLSYFENSLARGLEHLRIAFEWSNETNLSAWNILKERLEDSLSEAKAVQSKATRDS